MGAALETSSDVEWAYAMAPAASIVLIDTPSASNTYLLNDAVNYVVNVTHANFVSMSWGEAESALTSSQLPQNDSVFHYAATHGVILVSASGDNGANDSTSSPTVDYPSVGPDLVGAGGNTLILKNLSSTTATYSSEYAWNSSGGGISTYIHEPS